MPLLYPAHLTRDRQIWLGAAAVIINILLYWHVIRTSSRLHRLLPPKMSDHLLPQLAADAVLAIQRASKRDERSVLVGQVRHVPVVFDDVDDALRRSAFS